MAKGNGEERTSGVNRNFIPLRDPLRVNPLIRKIVRTIYGKVEVI